MTDIYARRPTHNLRSLTAARVSLPMSGHTIATSDVLELHLAHAQARDAVHTVFDAEAFTRRLSEELPVLQEQGVEVLTVHSCAVDRANYLVDPQRGRSLDAESAAALKPAPCDLAISIADGLSALAVEKNAIPLLAVLLPRLAEADWALGPVTVVQQGRVGICDAIGENLGARCSLILIGERPGLSAADSMGAYLTWEPRAGRGSKLPLQHSEWWIEHGGGGGAIDGADEDGAGDKIDWRGIEGGSGEFPAGGLEPASRAGNPGGIGAVGGAEFCNCLGEIVPDGAFGEAKIGGDFC